MLKTLFTAAVLAVGLLVTAPAAQAQNTTNWLTSDEYQAYFNAVVPGGMMPVSVRAGLVYGHVRYQATFAPTPAGMQWVARHGQSDSAFAETNAQYISQGYRLSFHDRFATEGMIRNQGLWVR